MEEVLLLGEPIDKGRLPWEANVDSKCCYFVFNEDLHCFYMYRFYYKKDRCSFTSSDFKMTRRILLPFVEFKAPENDSIMGN